MLFVQEINLKKKWKIILMNNTMMKNQNNTINSDIEAKKLLNFSIKFSYSLLYNGAEVYRVEDSINRICKSFQTLKQLILLH